MKDFNWSKYSKPIILVVFIIALSILRPKAFLSLDNFSNVLWSVAVIGIMVSGSIFVFLIGGIDLSIATLCAFSAVVVVSVTHLLGDTPVAVIVGVLCALAVGALAGAIHGIIITTFKIPAFLVTFASQSIFLGLAMVFTNNKIVSCTVPAFTAIGAFKILGFPLPVYFMVIIARDFRYQRQGRFHHLLRTFRSDNCSGRHCSCLHDTAGFFRYRLRLHE